MKSQIKEYMAKAGLCAILISGAREHNPSLIYFVGNAFFTSADLLIPADGEPILFHRVMEREMAAQTGVKCVCYSDLPRFKHDSSRLNELHGIMEYSGIHEGRIALCGRLEFGEEFSAVKDLMNLYPEIEWLGQEGDAVLKMVRFTKDAAEIESIRRMSETVTEVVSYIETYIKQQTLINDVLTDDQGQAVTIGRIRAMIDEQLSKLGGENPERTIFSIGHDAGVPHSQGNDNDVLRAGKSIVFDFFPCSIDNGFFSDFTRTWCIGYAPDEIEKAYQQVKEIHDLLETSIRTGMRFYKLQQMTCEYFRTHGHPAIDTDPSATSGYVHSIGHGLGLNIHEHPFSGSSSSERDVLIPGTVFTIEPGLYYPDLPEGYGVRIEDTYVMNEDGQVCKLTNYPYRLVLPVKSK